MNFQIVRCRTHVHLQRVDNHDMVEDTVRTSCIPSLRYAGIRTAADGSLCCGPRSSCLTHPKPLSKGVTVDCLLALHVSMESRASCWESEACTQILSTDPQAETCCQDRNFVKNGPASSRCALVALVWWSFVSQLSRVSKTEQLLFHNIVTVFLRY